MHIHSSSTFDATSVGFAALVCVASLLSVGLAATCDAASPGRTAVATGAQAVGAAANATRTAAAPTGASSAAPLRVAGPDKAPLTAPVNPNAVAPIDTLSLADRADLHTRYHKVLAKELGLLRALDALDRGAVAADQRLARLSLERANATDTLHAAETRRAAAERRLAEMRRAVRARLRALLRLRKVPALRFLLSAKDFAASVTKDRLLGKLVEGDRARLALYRAQVQRVAAITDKRNADLARIDKLNRDVHDEKARIERQRLDKKALIRQIEIDPIYNERARRDLDAADREMVDKIETLKEWQVRRYTFGRVKRKLLPPLARFAVEVPFGPRRHPRFGTVTWHRGIDFRTPGRARAQVRVVFWGRVAFVGWLTGYGTTLIIDHGKGWHTVYAHVEDVLVAEGEVVRSRQALATVGASGSLKGRYLYFEIRENGRAQNPQHWFR